MPDAPDDGRDVQLLNRRDALKTYGLTKYQLELARERGEIKRYQVGGEGRWYYAEDQLSALAEGLRRSKSSSHYLYSAEAA